MRNRIIGRQISRPRPTAETGTRLSGNISYARSFLAIRVRSFPDPCGKFTRGVLFRLIHRIIGPPMAKRARSTAETGTRLSGNISYVWSPNAIRVRALPGTCRNLSGRSCFTWEIELYVVREKPVPMLSGNWGATLWKYKLRMVAPIR